VCVQSGASLAASRRVCQRRLHYRNHPGSIRPRRLCLYNPLRASSAVESLLPAGHFRYCENAAAFVEPMAAKHEVTVVCGRPSYDPTERRAWRLWQQERTNNVRVIALVQPIIRARRWPAVC